jgi:hypothetical protein
MKTFLKDLKEGEQFYPSSQQGKRTPIFEVINQTTGIPLGLTKCKNLSNDKLVNKRKSLLVIRHSRANWKRDW